MPLQYGQKIKGIRQIYLYWKLSPLEKLYFNLKVNPTFPFVDLGFGLYYMLVPSYKKTFIFILVSVAIASFIILSSQTYQYPVTVLVVVLIMTFSIYSLVGNLCQKELFLSSVGRYVLRIKHSKKVLVDEPIHNICIKVNIRVDSNSKARYFLSLNGHELPSMRISGFISEYFALRLLATRMSETLSINFQDFECFSNSHNIIHRPDRRPPEATEIDKYYYSLIIGKKYEDMNMILRDNQVSSQHKFDDNNEEDSETNSKQPQEKESIVV